jgi:hypothetical protein
MSSKANRFAQVLLVFVWITIILREFTVPVSSQTCVIPEYMNPITIRQNSWVFGAKVIVEIDSLFTGDQYAGLKAGNEQWNNSILIACSSVEFKTFDSIVIAPEDYDKTPADGHLVWQRDEPGNGKNGIVLSVVNAEGRIKASRIKILPTAPNIAQGTYYHYLGTHEVGHTFNLNDCVSTNGCTTGTEPTIMRGHSDGITSSNTFNTSGPKECDMMKVRAIYCSSGTPTPTPTPSPTPPQTEQECQSLGWTWNSFISSCEPNGSLGSCPDTCIPQLFNEPGQGGSSCIGPATDYCLYPFGGCEPGRTNSGGNCCCSYASTPVLIDVAGDGFLLTNANAGVDFDINGDGIKERLAWTIPASDDAWLVLDHSNNGNIDNGRELFGNYTPQLRPPPGMPANGFLALAEYDKTVNGGNADGVITETDIVFSRLRLWQDANHNGTVENFELHTLGVLGIDTLELDYKESKRTDEHGNEFRYRAKVKNARGQQTGRWAWDVFLVKFL